jgi:hypothetical protein
MFSPKKHERRQKDDMLILFYFSYFTWIFHIAYSTAKFESNSDKTSHFIRPFWIVNGDTKLKYDIIKKNSLLSVSK